MLKQILRFRVVLIVLLMLVLFCPGAFAQGTDRGGNRGDNREDSIRYHGGGRHYYRNGRWYRHGWLGFDSVVTALAIGAFIDALPPRYTTFVVEDIPYYYDDMYYYRQLPKGGYVVVPAPVGLGAQYQSQAPETSTVNIPNSRGGYTSVTLRRSGNGFIGPQGEYYQNYPTVEQLKIMYGN